MAVAACSIKSLSAGTGEKWSMIASYQVMDKLQTFKEDEITTTIATIIIANLIMKISRWSSR
eukprot:4087057-Amphidinium_carterae.1